MCDQILELLKTRGQMKFNNLVKCFLAALVCLIILSCSDDQTTSPITPPPGNSNAPMAKFSDIQMKVFNSCAIAGCHSAASNQGNLTLTSEQSYSNLVNVQSVLFPSFKRVLPGDDGQSLLIKILKGEVSPRMPLNSTPLSNDVIDSIKAWINRGALNN